MKKNIFPQNLAAWLDYLETLHPQPIALGLERIMQLITAWGFTKPAPQVITVAGTNGKGSVVALLEACYQQANWRVGAFTSPHLIKFNERIKINGQEISDQDLVAAFTWVEENRQAVPLTFFEYSVLAAWKIFAAAQLDVLILEIGLGGRLDAVNAIPKDLAIITTVDYDHQNYLGDTLEKIAFEKAGIIAPETPVILGAAALPPILRQIANAQAAATYQFTREFSVQERAETWDLQIAAPTAKQYSNLPYPNFDLANAASSLMALELLAPSLPVPQEIICRVLREVNLAGRWQKILVNGVQIILDVAHNPQAMRNLAGKLSAEKLHGRTYCLYGSCSDKDFALNLKILKPMIEHWILVELQLPRTAKVDELGQQLAAANYSSAAHPVAGFQRALQMAQAGDRVLVCGSFYLVGPVLQECFSLGLL